MKTLLKCFSEHLNILVSETNYWVNNGDFKKAFQILEKHFKNRKIVPINCRDLIWGFGAIHCMTQQEPAI